MHREMASEHSEQGLELEETLAELEREYRDGELYYILFCSPPFLIKLCSYSVAALSHMHSRIM